MIPKLLKRVRGFCLNRAQSSPLYKSLVRKFRIYIEIKEANEQETRELYAMVSQKSSQPAYRHNSDVTNFLAKRKNNIIGYVQLVRRNEANKAFKEYWLFSLRVKGFYRRRGIGEELCRKAIEKATQEGSKELFGRVSEYNYPSIALLSKLGFKIKIIPELEKKLEEEKASQGRRRMLMAKPL